MHLCIHNRYVILSTSYCGVIIEVESSIQGHYTYSSIWTYILTYPNQKTLVVKKVVAKNLKKAILKICEIKMGSQDLLLLMELKFLIMMTRPQNITVAYQLLEVIVAGNSNVLQSGHY